MARDRRMINPLAGKCQQLQLAGPSPGNADSPQAGLPERTRGEKNLAPVRRPDRAVRMLVLESDLLGFTFWLVIAGELEQIKLTADFATPAKRQPVPVRRKGRCVVIACSRRRERQPAFLAGVN